MSLTISGPESVYPESRDADRGPPTKAPHRRCLHSASSESPASKYAWGPRSFLLRTVREKMEKSKAKGKKSTRTAVLINSGLVVIACFFFPFRAEGETRRQRGGGMTESDSTFGWRSLSCPETQLEKHLFRWGRWVKPKASLYPELPILVIISEITSCH